MIQPLLPVLYQDIEHQHSTDKEKLFEQLLQDVIDNNKWHGGNMIPHHNSTLFTAQLDWEFLGKVCIPCGMYSMLNAFKN